MIKTYFESTQQALASLCAAVLLSCVQNTRLTARCETAVYCARHTGVGMAEAALSATLYSNTWPMTTALLPEPTQGSHGVMHKTHMKNKA